jgi:hypothetical protein
MGATNRPSPPGNKKRHPLDDIFTWKLPVYGDEADKLIRKIAALSTGLETIEWWEKNIGWTTGPEGALSQAKIRYEEVLKRARDSGWHLSD